MKSCRYCYLGEGVVGVMLKKEKNILEFEISHTVLSRTLEIAEEGYGKTGR